MASLRSIHQVRFLRRQNFYSGQFTPSLRIVSNACSVPPLIGAVLKSALYPSRPTFRPRALFFTLPYCRINRQHSLGLLRSCARLNPFGSQQHDGSTIGPRRFSESARRHCFCLSRSKSKPCLMLIHLYFYMSLILTQQKTVLRKDNPIPFRLPEIFHIYVKNS